MKLDRVTITGVDNSTDVYSLISLSDEFPFVEWGILASASNTIGSGSSRFPTSKWISELREAVPFFVQLSLHLCGNWVRRLLMGDVSLLDCNLSVYATFPRIQLNFHGEKNTYDAPSLWKALRYMGKRQFIFQIDGACGQEILEAVYGENWAGANVEAVPLFDLSHGAGVLPDMWPKPFVMNDDIEYGYHGYAGGLGPDNLAEQLRRIDQTADCPVWIDMESRVRTDGILDLAKVRTCLEIAKPYIVKECA